MAELLCITVLPQDVQATLQEAADHPGTMNLENSCPIAQALYRMNPGIWDAEVSPKDIGFSVETGSHRLYRHTLGSLLFITAFDNAYGKYTHHPDADNPADLVPPEGIKFCFEEAR